MRLFFALWPDPRVRAALAGWVASCHADAGGRAVRASNLHLTLVFLGDVDEMRIPELHEIARDAAGDPFVLDLVEADYWRHNQIVHATPASVPDALLTLVENLREGLSQADFAVEERPFAAHATLVRDARREPMLMQVPAIRWQVGEFALVESTRSERGNVVYTPRKRWTLSGRTATLPASR
jgi:2'-5' RNA ligase